MVSSLCWQQLTTAVLSTLLQPLEYIARYRNKQILDWPVDCPIIKWTAHITERGLFARIFKAKVNYHPR